MNTTAISKEFFARILGCPEAQLPPAIVRRIDQANLRYASPTLAQWEKIVLSIFTRIDTEKLKRASKDNVSAFEAGWSENLELCRRQGITRANLKPKYVRPYEAIRFENGFILPDDPYILDSLLSITFHYSFSRYFSDVPAIAEFGCGTGQYLYDLSELFPDKKLIGTDWTQASVELLQLMKAAGRNIQGNRFDMLAPDTSFTLPPGSGVVTIGALEQIGDKFEPFLQYLISQKPAVVVHHEPILDFYTNDSLFDYVGRAWHRARSYLTGLYPRLLALQAEGRIEIIDAARIPFGDTYHESASRIVWRPR